MLLLENRVCPEIALCPLIVTAPSTVTVPMENSAALRENAEAMTVPCSTAVAIDKAMAARTRRSRDLELIKERGRSSDSQGSFMMQSP